MNTIKELKQQEKYNNMLKRKNKEIEKWKWQKELLIKRDKEHQQKIEDLKEQLEYQDLWRKEYLSRIDKAIEYIEDNMSRTSEGHFHSKFDGNVMEIYEILQGIDK